MRDENQEKHGRRKHSPMFCWILIVGGLLMMGQHDRSEALFYYFRLEDQVPETHLLRLIEKHISFAIVREKLKASYSDTGRPSIDPEPGAPSFRVCLRKGWDSTSLNPLGL